MFLSLPSVPQHGLCPGLLTQLVLILLPSASGVLEMALRRLQELILNFQETFKPVVKYRHY